MTWLARLNSHKKDRWTSKQFEKKKNGEKNKKQSFILKGAVEQAFLNRNLLGNGHLPFSSWGVSPCSWFYIRGEGKEASASRTKERTNPIKRKRKGGATRRNGGKRSPQRHARCLNLRSSPSSAPARLPRSQRCADESFRRVLNCSGAARRLRLPRQSYVC